MISFSYRTLSLQGNSKINAKTGCGIHANASESNPKTSTMFHLLGTPKTCKNLNKKTLILICCRSFRSTYLVHHLKQKDTEFFRLYALQSINLRTYVGVWLQGHQHHLGGFCGSHCAISKARWKSFCTIFNKKCQPVSKFALFVLCLVPSHSHYSTDLSNGAVAVEYSFLCYRLRGSLNYQRSFCLLLKRSLNVTDVLKIN